MKAKALNGKDLMLWLGEKVIALSTSCNIKVSVSTVDSNTKDDGQWDSQEVGSLGWTASNESVDSADESRDNDYVYDELFDLMVAGQPIDVTVGIPTNKSNDGVPEAGWAAPSTKCYKGKAIITDLDRTGAKGSNGSVSVSLQGQGALKKVGA